MPDARLDDFRKEVAYNLEFGALRDAQLPVTGVGGTRPIVTALADEPLAVMLNRLRDAGGTANVFIRGTDTVWLIPIVDSRAAIIDTEADVQTVRAISVRRPLQAEAWGIWHAT